MEFIISTIVIGFLCIASLVFIFLELQWMPFYVSVAFYIWVVCCIVTIALSKGKDKKWYERMVPSFVFTFVFTFLFFASLDTALYTSDDDIYMWLVYPTLSLPIFYLIGIFLNGKWLKIQEAKRQKFNENIDKQIDYKHTEIQKLESSIKNKIIIMHFVSLLDYCGEDISRIESDPRISNIAKIFDEIKQEKNEIVLLQKSKK